MSVEVMASIEIPLFLNHAAAYSKDAHRPHPRRPFPTRQDRHARALLRAVQHNDLGYLHQLLDHGVSPKLHLRHDECRLTTALHIAIETGQERMTALLLSRGADRDATDESGQTPLDLACKKRNFKAIELLVNNGASLSQPSTRVACLGLTFFNLMSPTHDVTSWEQVLPSDLDCKIMENAANMAFVLLDHGFARGWNGINSSFSYLNRVYNRHKNIFLLLLQAANDCKDDIFTDSCYTVLVRRRDADTLLKLHRYGYGMRMAIGLKRHHKHTTPGPCRLEVLSTPCPLMALCRVKIRQTLRQSPGPISRKISEFDIPKCVQRYLGFAEC